MRFEGKLDKWNDDRGFGFITPTRGGEPVFVHISAFARDGRRPQLGELLTFEVEPAGDGKKRAINVQRPGSRPPSPAPMHKPRREHAWRSESPRRERPGIPFGRVVSVLVLLGLGGYAYMQFSARLKAGERQAEGMPSTMAPAPATPAYRCDGRTHCSQMTSCAEAKFFLKNCPGTKMDGDGDGVPCESQWCSDG